MNPNEKQRLADALAGRYTIEHEVGRGGMAVVYRAVDLKHDRRVAITVLNPELAQALGPDRFLREIKLTGTWAGRPEPLTSALRETFDAYRIG